jgi:hypothetical protein
MLSVATSQLSTGYATYAQAFTSAWTNWSNRKRAFGLFFLLLAIGFFFASLPFFSV